MSNSESFPVMAEAVDVLSDAVRLQLKRVAAALRPETDRLEARFLVQLEKLGFDVRQRRAVAALTLGNAARFLARGCPLADFFEEVEYNGRRLAKLNLPPSGIVSALSEYDQLLTPVLKKVAPKEVANYQVAREQLQFCVMLTLNNAYYEVRETETRAFYEMYWAELESRSLDELLERSLAVLARFCKADEAHLYLLEDSENGFVQHASFGSAGTPPVQVAGSKLARLRKQLAKSDSFAPDKTPRVQGGVLALDPSWKQRFATCWSVPLVSYDQVAGVLQFGFTRHYEWLPRELELLTAAAERCMKAAEKARLVEDLAQQQVQIRYLAERMIHVEEAERRRISRELHDQTGQDLLCMRLEMEMIEGELPEAALAWKHRLAGVRDLTEKTIIEIRRLIAALSPAVLEQLGLAAAMRQLVNRFRQHQTCRIRLQIGRLKNIPKSMEVIVYRLLQECLNNIAKHSFCSNVNILLSSADGLLRLYVEDDGVGFQVEQAAEKPGSFGLAGIRERVALLGGTCSITSKASTGTGKSGSGTKIRLELPFNGYFGADSKLELGKAPGDSTSVFLVREKSRAQKARKASAGPGRVSLVSTGVMKIG